MHAYRTHSCAELFAEHIGENVRLSGWVHRKRDHGGVLFIDLRDHYGITQIVADADSPALPILESVRVESVITIDGLVKARAEGTTNANLETGEIEVFANSITVQSAAQELPMPVAGEAEYPEEIRLRNRFLDLRRETLHANIVLRSGVIASLRRRMIDQGFTEFQTPILTASSPEGARDYLVPSRVHPGKFYALPQAPQMFKQLLMVAGFDRYFQIAPCFRDEDARADRSPGEFYQLDFEMSFVTQEDVFAAIEPVLHGVFEEYADWRQGAHREPAAVPAHSLSRVDAQVWQRQAGPAQSDPDLGRVRGVRGLGLRPLRLDRRGGRRRARDPGTRHGREEPQILRRHEQLGAERGLCRPRLCDAQGRRMGRPDRQESWRGR
jgi:aspartyl-tRNA synthetase